jgi:hypothetical protein
MFVAAPIDRNFVPHKKRSVLRRNAGLFVDGKTGSGRGASRVVLQAAWEGDCSKLPPGAYCYIGSCRQGIRQVRKCDADRNCGGLEDEPC